MSTDDEHQENHDNLEDTVRSIAEELGRSVEHMMGQLDVEDVADAIGVDPMRAREWMDTATGWLRAKAENLGDEVARGAGHARSSDTGPGHARGADAGARSSDAGAAHTGHGQREDPLRSAAPHPLDLPTDEQGLALAALDSGRWTVEPGSNALAAQGEGPGPSDALGLVRELRSRDWIRADGEVTPAGRHALTRWLDASAPH